MSTRNRFSGLLLHDLLIIAASIGIAVILVKAEVVVEILASTRGWEFFGSFIAGLFFTSVFTTAPAIVALGEIARFDAVMPTAFFGALGAVIGDLIIFRFVRDRFSEHILELASHRNVGRKIKRIFRLRLFRWISFFIGGLILASPLPDELGIGLLGFSKINMSWFVPLSFFFNFIGILFIGFIARAM